MTETKFPNPGLGTLNLQPAPGVEFVVYSPFGDLIKIYPKPYSIYLMGTIGFRICGVNLNRHVRAELRDQNGIACTGLLRKLS